VHQLLAVREKQLTERSGMKQQSTDGTLIWPAADEVASVEPEALSRFVGEGGAEAPVPVGEPVGIPLENGIWRKPRPAAHQANQKKTGPRTMKFLTK
jgi:hypothetical protein